MGDQDMPKDMLDLESREEPLAPTSRFIGRLILSVAAASLVVALSLAAGVWGYCHFEGLSVVDGFLNAAMILSGMGPVAQMSTHAGKIFAGVYALYSGLMLVATTGMILAPVVHRFLHKFHIDTD